MIERYRSKPIRDSNPDFGRFISLFLSMIKVKFSKVYFLLRFFIICLFKFFTVCLVLILKVVPHEGNVLELQLAQRGFTALPGQVGLFFKPICR